MPNNVFSITCPVDCAAATLGVLPASYCQLGARLAEIDTIILQGTDAGPTDMSVALDWAAKIDNTDATGAKMKFLVGSGTIGEPEEAIVTVARFQELVVRRDYSLVFEVSELSDSATYDFLRRIQCGSITPKFYYTSIGGFLYGKKVASGADTGIAPDSIKVSFLKEKGKDAVDKALLTIKFSGTTDPDRVANPLTI
jgi:hypothetical protein